MHPSSKPGKLFTIAGTEVLPGNREFIDLKLARLPTDTWVTSPIMVANGRYAGPALWLNAAIHGDEINGVEVIRRLIPLIPPEKLHGTVVAVPIVNVFGFINQSRYLPDRRDLNRSFPGSERGSLGSRIANLFLTEVVAHCQYGIDMHTGANHRSNLPQIRGDMNDPHIRKLAQAFAPPILVHSDVRDGSLREAAQSMGKAVVIYEGGEPSRFNQNAIEIGVAGVLRVLDHLGMLRASARVKKKASAPLFAERTTWIRAKRSGILRVHVDVGGRVAKDEVVAVISDALDREQMAVKAPSSGVIVGVNKLPLVNQGDAIANLAILGGSPVALQDDSDEEEPGEELRGRRNRAPRHTIFLER